MLKLAAIGVWVILVTAGAAYGSRFLGGQAGGEIEKPDKGLEALKSEMTSIPILRNGDVIGYLIMQLSFAADRHLLEEKKLDPMPFMMDAAFRVVLARTDIDFRRLQGEQLDTLTAEITKAANSRIGAELVQHVLLQQVNYVNKDDIRTNWIGGGSGGEHDGE